LSTALRVKEYLRNRNETLPANVELLLVNDESLATIAMLDVLVSNALAGIVLARFAHRFIGETDLTSSFGDLGPSGRDGACPVRPECRWRALFSGFHVVDPVLATPQT
jgi:hypothetical protein